VDLLNGKVTIRRQTELFRVNVHNHKHRVGVESPDDLVDRQIRRTQLGPAMVPTHDALLGCFFLKKKYFDKKKKINNNNPSWGLFFTIHFAKHGPHGLEVVVVKEPNVGVVLVLFKGNYAGIVVLVLVFVWFVFVLPAKLFATSTVLPCQEPRRTPTTRFFVSFAYK